MKKILSCFIAIIILFSFVFSAFAIEISDFVSDPKCYFDGTYQHDFVFIGCNDAPPFGDFGLLIEFIYDSSLYDVDFHLDSGGWPLFFVNRLHSDLDSFPVNINCFVFHGLEGELEESISEDLFFVDYEYTGSGIVIEYFGNGYPHYQLFPNMKSDVFIDPSCYMSEAPYFEIQEQESTSSVLPVAPTDYIEDVGSPSLPVADPSFFVEDVGSEFPTVDLSSSVYLVLQWFVSAFRKIIFFFDSVIIYNNTSLLDFHIAVSIFGILFAVLFVTVRSSVGNSISSVDRSNRSKRNRGVD